MVTTSLGEVINNLETVMRITKWAIELMGYEVSYVPKTRIKSQVLANFVAEWTETQMEPTLAKGKY